MASQAGLKLATNTMPLLSWSKHNNSHLQANQCIQPPCSHSNLGELLLPTESRLLCAFDKVCFVQHFVESCLTCNGVWVPYVKLNEKALSV